MLRHNSLQTRFFLLSFFCTLLYGQIAHAKNDDFKLKKMSQTDRIIVKYHPGMTPPNTTSHGAMANSLTNAMGLSAHLMHSMSNGAQVIGLSQLMDEGDVEKICDRIESDPRVAYAVPDSKVYIMAAEPNDSRFSEQWHYHEKIGGINLMGAWDVTEGADDVVVAVIDTGIVSHTDLEGQTVGGYDFISEDSMAVDGDGRDDDPTDEGDWMYAGECSLFYPPVDVPSSWHGTHVTGTIVAKTNNNVGVAGIAHGARVQPIRALGKCGGYTSDIVDAMRWAAGMSVDGVPANQHPAKIINMSLGGFGQCHDAYQEAIDDIVARGVTVVVAAGNSKRDAKQFRPANCQGVITVAATDRFGGLAPYSNYGSKVEISAPGGVGLAQNGVLSTANAGQKKTGGENYLFYPGTSMATPHVSGVIALMLSVNPDLTPNTIAAIIRGTAREFPKGGLNACTTSRCGSGILDANAAVRMAQLLAKK